MFLKGCIGACNNHANGLKKMHFFQQNQGHISILGVTTVFLEQNIYDFHKTWIAHKSSYELKCPI